jgi:antitoxin component of RelBE/YafQ-DinJ toxin-antitoxin module
MKTTLTIKTEKDLKNAAKRTADKLGIPLTTVINAQLEQFVREGRFEVSLVPRPEKVREWERLSEYADQHPEEETLLRSAEEIQKHFRKVWGRSSDK